MLVLYSKQYKSKYGRYCSITTYKVHLQQEDTAIFDVCQRGLVKSKRKNTYVQHTWEFPGITAAQKPTEVHVFVTYVVFYLLKAACLGNRSVLKSVCDVRVSSLASGRSNWK